MASMEEMLQLLAHVYLPQPNQVPTTLHQLHQLLGINVDQFEEHVCVNGCSYFEKRLKSEWYSSLDERCPHCEELRFEIRGKTVAPRKKFYRIPLSFQIQNLTHNPEFLDSLTNMKRELESGLDCNESFWGASIVEDLVGQPAFLEEFHLVFALSLALDGVNCFKSTQYSVWPVCIKIWNLHPEQRTSRGFTLLAALIPGPGKPERFEGYLEPILNEIMDSTQGVFLFQNLTLYSRPSPFCLFLFPFPLFLFLFLFPFSFSSFFGSPSSSPSSSLPLSTLNRAGVSIQNGTTQEEEGIAMVLKTCEFDHQANISATENMGPATACNCWRCWNRGTRGRSIIFSSFHLHLFIFSSIFYIRTRRVWKLSERLH